jgi:hypothetical protein
MLLVSAMILISGKQNQTAFDQSIRQIQSQIQQHINEVSTGYYSNQGNIRCNGVSNVVALSAGGGTEQGANAGCVFLGKVMQFQVGTSSPEQFNVFSVAGLQKNSGAEVTSLGLAKPKAIAPSAVEPGLPDATETQTLQNGLKVVKMWYNNGAGDRQIGEVGFMTSFVQFASNGTLASGSQQVDVIPIDDGNVNSKLGQTKTAAVTAINSNTATSPANPSSGVFICIASGTTNQSGLITIGNKNRQLSVKLDIKNGTVC